MKIVLFIKPVLHIKLVKYPRLLTFELLEDAHLNIVTPISFILLKPKHY